MPIKEENFKCGIYCIENLVNGKKYIGSSTFIQGRFGRHKSDLRNNQHRNRHLQGAFNKYGMDSFKFYVIEECYEKQLTSFENYWINDLKTRDREIGYNFDSADRNSPMTKEKKESIRLAFKNMLAEDKERMRKNQSLGALKFHSSLTEDEKKIQYENLIHKSDETIEKIRIGNTGKIVSEEIKQKISIRTKGSNNPRYGKEVTKETREKMSKALKGRIISKESILKMIKSNTGKKRSEEVKKNMSIKMKEAWAKKKELGIKRVAWNKGIKKNTLRENK